MMKEKIQRRIAELKEEFESGQKVLAELDEKRERLKEQMLRIAGAIQVLTELEQYSRGRDRTRCHPLQLYIFAQERCQNGRCHP
jgi:chromosome segregation ATPase